MPASASAGGPRRIGLGRIALELTDTGAGRPILFLHGFPECAAAWGPVIAHLPGFRCLAPNQRGYGQSSRPAGTAAYAIPRLAADAAALLRATAHPATVVGHDWGGVVASWLAAQYPHLVERLVLANGPHPAAFQQALLHDPQQRAASAYIARLRAPATAGHLTAAGPEALWQNFFANDPAMASRRDAYLAAWSPPGAIRAMLQWYRAAPFVLPEPGTTPHPAWLDAQDLTVHQPVLAIWGTQDPVLLPTLPERFAEYCPNFRIARLAESGHGVIHQQPAEVARLLQEFIG